MVPLGVRTAIDLDMSRGWPAAFVYWHTNSVTSGAKINHAIANTVNIRYDRRLKDFVVSLFC
jgi:hypothetical protein